MVKSREIGDDGSVAPFPRKCFEMVDDNSTDSIISWNDTGDCFVIWDMTQFSVQLLPKFFKHNNFSSFVRQLNTYGFKKVDPDRWEFANEGFLRGQKHLLKTINRRKPTHTQNGQQAQPPSSKVAACVEVGNFGLEEEVDRLKRDKNVLMQELVRLRQQQQATDSQLQNVGQRVQVMEQRQQQMMSFLAKAMHRPGFLAQFVQQQNESSRQIIGGNKKRRLPRQDDEKSASEHWNNAPDGQIIKFQPSMNEAARAMLQQILKMNGSPRREPSLNNPDAFLIDSVSSTNVLDNGTGNSRFSEVSLSEVTQNSGKSFAQGESGFPSLSPLKAIPEIRSSPHVVSNYVEAAQEERVMPDLVGTQGAPPKRTEELPDVNFVNSGTTNAESMDMSAVLDAEMLTDSDAMFPDTPDGNILFCEVPKLPAFSDSLWEQFFPGEDTDEINSSYVDGGMTHDQDLQVGKENGWDHDQRISHLTEGMGLLSSECRRA